MGSTPPRSLAFIRIDIHVETQNQGTPLDYPEVRVTLAQPSILRLSGPKQIQQNMQMLAMDLALAIDLGL